MELQIQNNKIRIMNGQKFLKTRKEETENESEDLQQQILPWGFN